MTRKNEKEDGMGGKEGGKEGGRERERNTCLDSSLDQHALDLRFRGRILHVYPDASLSHLFILAYM